MTKLEISDEKFEKIKNEAEVNYKNIDKIYCPYLKFHVNFNAKGLDHLKFKKFGHARLRADQYVRLRLLNLASTTLNSSHTLQGYFKTKNFERQNLNSK